MYSKEQSTVENQVRVFEVCLTNYCNFKCSYCISDKSRGFDKFSEPLKTDTRGNLLIHPNDLPKDEIEKRLQIKIKQGQEQLDKYVAEEHEKWLANRDSKHDHGDWLDFDALIGFVKNKLSREWVITLTGGEPLYYPKVERLILELVKTNRVIVTTNASLISTKKELLDIDRNSIGFRVGFHPEQRSIKKFTECMKYIINNNFKYIVTYVAHPSYFKDGELLFKQHISYLEDKKYLYEVIPFEGVYENTLYPTPKCCRSKFECEIFSKFKDFEVLKCDMGVNFIMCDPTGRIYECASKTVEIGDVYTNKLNLQRVNHFDCFSYLGCNTSLSANTYLRLLFNSQLKLCN